MSYFSTIATRRIVLASKASLAKAPRQFSTTITAQKSATETVKDSLKTVDRKVSDKLVEGINAGGKFFMECAILSDVFLRYLF